MKSSGEWGSYHTFSFDCADIFANVSVFHLLTLAETKNPYILVTKSGTKTIIPFVRFLVN